MRADDARQADHERLAVDVVAEQRSLIDAVSSQVVDGARFV
jgi:hypothetical protein